MKRTRQGVRDEARPNAHQRYRWFIEGFDTPDLKRGKASLHDLKGPALTSLQQAWPHLGRKAVTPSGTAGFSTWPIDHSTSVARVSS